ncbi:MAG: Lrp/AsnC family transcriptional regulator [Thermoplasmataceae archaeon]
MADQDDRVERRHRIDSIDLEIIDMIESDCTLSYEDIAEKIGKNLWTVRDRIILLKRKGVIRGCKGIIDYSSIGMSCTSIISFNVPPDQIDRILQYAKEEKRIKRITITTGERRFWFKIVGKDCSEIREYARNELPKFGIYNIDFEVVLDEFMKQ